MGGNSVSKHHPALSVGNEHQIQPDYYGDEQADAGRDCRNRLETKFSGANAVREKFIFPVQLTIAGWATLNG